MVLSTSRPLSRPEKWTRSAQKRIMEWMVLNCRDKINLTATSEDGIPLFFFEATKNNVKLVEKMINEYDVDLNVKDITDNNGNSVIDFIFPNYDWRQEPVINEKILIVPIKKEIIQILIEDCKFFI